MREVTFKDFAAVAKKRGHTIESLADRFRGNIENPAEFFERVMSCKYKGEDRSGVVIPYRSVLEFYSQELHYFQDSNAKHRHARAVVVSLPLIVKSGRHQGVAKRSPARKSRTCKRGFAKILILLMLDCDKIRLWLP